ncbi:MAG: SGNH/GDSL hydrolase family protein [Clostridia bacterium]|nr:SGNH/GDSL hydrolase family protein [Clostridia bacterium]
MNLSNEQIRMLVKGAASYEECAEGLRLHRFTKQEREYYKTVSEDFYMKAHSSSGVRLEFTTDSRRFSFAALTAPGSSRPFCHFDLYRDGIYMGQVGTEQMGSGVAGEFDLGEGEKELRLYFPWSAAPTLTRVTLDDGASFAPLKKAHTMLIYGDSITQGYDTHHPSLSYASLLTDALDAEGFNKAIGGEFFCPGLVEAGDGTAPDIITVAYGTNDWSKKTKEEFETNCRGFYETLSRKYPDAKIFAITPIWRGDCQKRITEAGEFPRIAKTIEAVAASLPNVTVLHGYDCVPKEERFFADLYLHPNDEGFVHYFEGIYQQIKQYM